MSLKDIHLLDAGAGTGNYAKALIDFGLEHITLADASSEMLSVAREKLSCVVERNAIHDIIQTKFPPFPFSDGMFDAVMFNQVLHHLDKTPEGTEFPVLQKALVDTKRILRHRGMLFITSSLPSTIKEAVWFHQVHPGITDKIRKAFISAEQYQNFFTNNGYQCVAAMNLLSVTKQTQLVNYFDHEGPLKTEWRKGTSVYEIATEEELEELEEKLLSIEETQSLQQFMMEHDRTSEMGVLTIFACISV